ncbi:hypothetical protein ASG51_09645 [Methylobacterium sp. Leaf465]|uniref:hypothetical protein n=1 Tax=Methylobacterium sp. Leaf465 TaxID=1736385 RepID=UPI0006FC915A|nr:hypothetical protein [Methylobacterium sp. Leaf465]KQT73705.1 hypothetical protein ASG51_09645 [Methylobacterium sp. Leaf465]
MPAESRIAPDDVPALAAEATALIDAALSRLPEADRAAFWASVRKCYNTPYNDPEPRALTRVQRLAAFEATGPDPAESPTLSTLAAPALASVMAALPGVFAAEPHAA